MEIDSENWDFLWNQIYLVKSILSLKHSLQIRKSCLHELSGDSKKSKRKLDESYISEICWNIEIANYSPKTRNQKRI